MSCIVTPKPPAPHAPCMRALAPSYDTQTLGGPPGRTFHGTGGQSGTRPYLYGRTCPASIHLWLRQLPQSPRLRQQPQRTQVGESHTRLPPLAAPGGTGGGHRAGGHAGSVARAESCRWRRRVGGGYRTGGAGGLSAGGGATAGGAVATAALGAATALAAAGMAAADASPGATAAGCPAASPGVGGAAEAEGTCG